MLTGFALWLLIGDHLRDHHHSFCVQQCTHFCGAVCNHDAHLPGGRCYPDSTHRLTDAWVWCFGHVLRHTVMRLQACACHRYYVLSPLPPPSSLCIQLLWCSRGCLSCTMSNHLSSGHSRWSMTQFTAHCVTQSRCMSCPPRSHCKGLAL